MYINVQETYMYSGGLASNGVELSISACIYIELNGPWQCRDMARSMDDLISRYIFKEWVNLIPNDKPCPPLWPDVAYN